MNLFGLTITVETLKGAATLLIFVLTVYSFVREKIPPDLTALLSLCALVVTRVLEPAEAFAGFSHSATVSVAAILVLSAAVERTDLLNLLARRVLTPLGKSEFLFTLLMMIVIGSLSAFINNTAAVAIFIPVVLEVCQRTGASPGRVLMPMSHAATLGGMCTLIGTSTNLVAHEFALSQGLPGFSMFELGKVGLPVLGLGFAYMLLVGRWFLPKNSVEGSMQVGGDNNYLAELLLQANSPWIGREIEPAAFQRSFDVELLGVKRKGRWVDGSDMDGRFAPGDLLHTRGALKQVLELAHKDGMGFRRTRSYYLPREASPTATELPTPRLAEVVVLTPSGLIGQTLQGARFAERYDTVVLALRRRGGQGGPISTTPLHAGDVLVVEGDEDSLVALSQSAGFLMIGTPARPEKRAGQLAITLSTLAGVIAAVSFGLIPIVTAAVTGCAILMVTRCLSPREGYRAIDMSLIFTLAGSLALGAALEKTGITAMVAQGLSFLNSPYLVLVGFFLVAVLVSELMSNSGTVALLGPMAISTAAQLGANPMALLAAVTFGASAAFAMPIGYQTSLMIYGAGGYRFVDFLRMGIVLDVLIGIVALALIPYYWPLTAR
jgi:di/tricarboxylate transporter